MTPKELHPPHTWHVPAHSLKLLPISLHDSCLLCKIKHPPYPACAVYSMCTVLCATAEGRTSTFFPVLEKIPDCLLPSESDWLGRGREGEVQTCNSLGQVGASSGLHFPSHSRPPPLSPPAALTGLPSRNRKAIWCLFGTVHRQDVLCAGVCQQSCPYEGLHVSPSVIGFCTPELEFVCEIQ